MKKRFIFMLTLLVSALSGWAQEVVIDKIHYRVNDAGTEAYVCGSDEDITDAVILEQVAIEGLTYKVTNVGWGVFWGRPVKSVFFPKTITYICSDRLFGENGGVVETLKIDPENPLYDSRDNCNAIIETQSNRIVLVLPCSTIPNSVKTISGVSVWGHYENFIVPEGVENIESNTFNYGNYEPGIIKNIVIPKSVKSIGGNPWWWSVANVSIDEENPYYYSQNNCVIEKGSKRLIATGTNATIPNDINSFGPDALNGWAVEENNTLVWNQEIPSSLNVGRLAERSISLSVPEGCIPNYIGAGWGLCFKVITDGHNYYYGHAEGDTWYAPHIDVLTATAGDEVTLSVVLNADQPVVGFQFDLYLPEGIEVTTDEDGYEDIYLSTARTTERKHTLTAQQQTDGSWRVMCYSNNNSTFSGNEGEVCTIRVRTSADMDGQGYPIILRNVVTSYLNGEGNVEQSERDKLTSYINFFTPKALLFGDANGDNEVNVTDIATVVSYIMTGQASPFRPGLADADQNGSINVGDITTIVDIIMKGEAASIAVKRQ